MIRILKFYIISIFIVFFLSACGGNGDDEDDNNGGQLSLPSARLTVGIVGQDYEDTYVGVSGGSTPYIWDVQLSNLPPGISAQGNTNSIEFVGTPVVAGTYDFGITVTDDNGDSIASNFTMTVVNSLDISGDWNYQMDVYEVSVGGCDDNESNTHTITVSQNGGVYTFAGFWGDPTSRLTGSTPLGMTYPAELTIGGSYPEGSYTLHGTHELKVYSNNFIGGIEYWDWKDGFDLLCRGEATVTATR